MIEKDSLSATVALLTLAVAAAAATVPSTPRASTLNVCQPFASWVVSSGTAYGAVASEAKGFPSTE